MSDEKPSPWDSPTALYLDENTQQLYWRNPQTGNWEPIEPLPPDSQRDKGDKGR